MENAVKSQKGIIFFLWKEGVKPSEMYQRLYAVFGKCAVSRGTVYRWIDLFKADRTTLEDLQNRRNTAGHDAIIADE